MGAVELGPSSHVAHWLTQDASLMAQHGPGAHRGVGVPEALVFVRSGLVFLCFTICLITHTHTANATSTSDERRSRTSSREAGQDGRGGRRGGAAGGGRATKGLEGRQSARAVPPQRRAWGWRSAAPHAQQCRRRPGNGGRRGRVVGGGPRRRARAAARERDGSDGDRDEGSGCGNGGEG